MELQREQYFFMLLSAFSTMTSSEETAAKII